MPNPGSVPGVGADQGTVTDLARVTMGSPGGELCIGDVYLPWEYTDTFFLFRDFIKLKSPLKPRSPHNKVP